MSRQAKRAAATKDALIDLVREALGLKLAVELDRPDATIEHLDGIDANLATIRTNLQQQPPPPNRKGATP